MPLPWFANYRDFVRLEGKVDALLRLSRESNQRTKDMAKTLAEVQAQTADLLEAVRKNADQTDSIKTLVNGLRSQIDDLKSQIDALQAAGGASPDDLQGLSDQLGAAITSIDADTAAEAVLATPEPVTADGAAQSADTTV